MGEANWLTSELPLDGEWKPCMAKFRYNTPAASAQFRVICTGADQAVTPSGRTGRFEVRFDQPQTAVTPGQALVVYSMTEPDHVLGGGWIDAVR